MALPSSGQISLGDIRTELGSILNIFSLQQAEAGIYGAINQNSTNKPNGIAPNAVSEWYGYNHTASSSLTAVTLFYATVQSFACAGTPNTTYYVDASPWTSAGFIYTDSAGTTPAANGWYQRESFARPVTGGNGQLGSGTICL
jgi:hypothetical protein